MSGNSQPAGNYSGPGQTSGSSGGKNSPPPSPDFGAAAKSDFQSGVDATNTQTTANRANQNTPWASQQWVMGPNGQWQQSTNLNGQLGTAANNLQGQLASNTSTPFDNGTQSGQQAFNAAYSQEMGQLNPQMAQQNSALDAQLSAQGLSPGSAAYNAAKTQLASQQNQAMQGALNNAVGLGNAEQAQTFGQNMQARQMPLQELQQMEGFLAMPGYNAAGAWGPSNYLGAAGQAGAYNMNAWDTQQQMQADEMQGITQMLSGVTGGLGSVGKIATLSDERMKSNVRRLPVEAIPGVPLATFKYKHAPKKGHQLGVIAQDVEKVRPDAVHEDEGGIKHVDYSKLKPFGTR